MLKRNYIYQLKELFRVKMVMFWNLFFPMMLATIMAVSFSNLDAANMVGTINVGTDNEIFKQSIRLMEEGGDTIFKLIDVSDPQVAVADGEITGYFYSDGSKLLIKEDNLKSSVLINVLNIFRHKTELIKEAGKGGFMTPENSSNVINELTKMDNYVESDFDASGKSGVNTFYYAMLAMVCLGATTTGATAVSKMNNLPENIFAKRLLISPVSKMDQIITRLSSTLTVNLFQTFVVLGYMVLILKVDFGSKTGFLLLGVVIGTVFGLLLGIVISLLLNKGEDVVIGVCTAFYLSSVFLAGMMHQNIPQILEEKLPIINRINPATIISKYYYTLYYFDDVGEIMERLTVLVIATAIAAVFAFILARRRENANG